MNKVGHLIKEIFCIFDDNSEVIASFGISENVFLSLLLKVMKRC